MDNFEKRVQTIREKQGLMPLTEDDIKILLCDELKHAYTFEEKNYLINDEKNSRITAE